MPDKVMFEVNGQAVIENQGESLLELKSGDFIGGISYITGNPNKFRDRHAFEKTIETDP